MRFILSLILLTAVSCNPVFAEQPVKTLLMLTDATATGAGTGYRLNGVHRTFMAYGSTSAGAGSCSVKVQVSDDGVTYLDAATISLVLSTTVVADGFASIAPWKFGRANVSAIAGTNAKCSLLVGATVN